MSAVGRILFLPGASGDPEFWRPVADLLPASWEKSRLGWPGLGEQPHDPSVRGLEDLVKRVVEALARPSDLVAQSMGAVVAVRVAARHPEKVRRLVLAATSGGLDMTAFGAADWREEYRRSFPNAAPWITEPVPGHDRLMAKVVAPVLILAGESDPVSPVDAAVHLGRLLPHATIEVVPGGDHGFARDQPGVVARLIVEHLR